MAHRYNEAGRRLMAAVLSYQMDLSLNYTLKRYVPEEVGDGWARLAEAIMTQLAEQMNTGVAPSEAGPFLIQ